MMKLQFTLLLLLTVFISHASVYFVDDTNGSDTNDGLSYLTAWQTLNKVNTFALNPGDSVLFKRDGVWRGQLLPQSGNSGASITYSAYGFGLFPLFFGSADVSSTAGWISEGNNIWRSTQTSPVDVGSLIFNFETAVGVKKWTQAALQQQGDFWYDKTGTQTVKLYSVTNPGQYYSHIEAALGKFIVYMTVDSFINLNNLAFKYGSADGIEVRNSHHINITDCFLSYIGGCELTNQVRYGGGIQFWANSNNNYVERCRFSEIYDDAVTNQGNITAGGTLQQYNLYYRNNVISNCSESSFCLMLQPAITSGSFMKNIYFENNTCIHAGGGWAAAQRPDRKGFQVYCSAVTAATDSIFIRNNIFYQSRCVYLFDNTSVHVLSKTISDYNCWFTSTATDTVVAFWTSSSLSVYNANQFSSYQVAEGEDSHTFLADPLFINASIQNYHLSSPSPCVNTGVANGLSNDIEMSPRPQGSGYDIGAYEYAEVLGILNTVDEQAFEIYPNPTSGTITVKTAEKLAGEFVSIIDATGKKVYSAKISSRQTLISTNSLVAGIYWVWLGNESRRLIVTK